jgi:hypothetical protein
MEQDIINRIIAANDGKYCNLNNIEKNYLKQKYKEFFSLELNTSCGSCLMNAIYKVAPKLQPQAPIIEVEEEPKNELESKTVVELKEICKTLDLPIYGNKETLIKRIQNV